MIIITTNKYSKSYSETGSVSAIFMYHEYKHENALDGHSIPVLFLPYLTDETLKQGN